MNATVTTHLSDDDRIVLLRDAASAAGCSERTLREHMSRRGFRVVAITPKKIGVRKSDFQQFLKACEA